MLRGRRTEATMVSIAQLVSKKKEYCPARVKKKKEARNFNVPSEFNGPYVFTFSFMGRVVGVSGQGPNLSCT
jgi:hypothetical protein